MCTPRKFPSLRRLLQALSEERKITEEETAAERKFASLITVVKSQHGRFTINSVINSTINCINSINAINTLALLINSIAHHREKIYPLNASSALEQIFDRLTGASGWTHWGSYFSRGNFICKVLHTEHLILKRVGSCPKMSK